MHKQALGVKAVGYKCTYDHSQTISIKQNQVFIVLSIFEAPRLFKGQEYLSFTMFTRGLHLLDP